MEADAVCRFLADHDFFRGLSAGDVADLSRLASVRTLTRGELLALEGDACTAVYFVMQGRVLALKMSPEGREQVVSELGVGQSFYLVPALDGAPLPVTTRAATRATLLSFAVRDWNAVLQRHPGVALRVLVDLARRLRRLTTLVEDLSLRTVPQRLARLFLERAMSAADHHMTQREMAAQLGTVREVVARTLTQFERQGWIRVQRGVIEIRVVKALRELAAA